MCSDPITAITPIRTAPANLGATGISTTACPNSNPSSGDVGNSDVVAEFSIQSGPNCTGTVSLTAGRHVIGRSPSAHISIADGGLGLHHAVVDVEQGSVTLTQLSGQAPIRIGGEPIVGTRTAALPARVSIGMHEVQINPPSTRDLQLVAEATGCIVATPDDPGKRIVQRGPDRPMTPAAGPIAPPSPADVQHVISATAVIGVGLGVLGFGVTAGLLSRAIVALVVACGAVVVAICWVVGALATSRHNRTSRRLADDDRRRFLDDLEVAGIDAQHRHLIAHPDLGRTIAIADGLTDAETVRSDVWQRRLVCQADDRGGKITFRPVIGTGTSRWSPTLAGDLGPDSVTDVDCAATIDDVPIPVALTCGSVTAISGGRMERDALLRSILCQMAVRHGPADWQLVIVASACATWAWADGFPHAHTSSGTVLITDPTDPDDLATVLMLADGPTARPTLLIVDDPGLFTIRGGALRWFVERAQPAALTTIDVGADAPAMCTDLIEIGSTGAVMTTRLDGSTDDIADAASSIRMSGLSMERAASIAGSLAGLVDPEFDGCSAARCIAEQPARPVLVPNGLVVSVVERTGIETEAAAAGRSSTTGRAPSSSPPTR